MLRRRPASSSVRPLMYGREAKSKDVHVLDESAHLTNITTNSSGEGIVCVRGSFFTIFEIIDKRWPLACKHP